jgi:NAD(P)-dependent dehydrogenase (short-subunit alcohol dehydrogenase family)
MLGCKHAVPAMRETAGGRAIVTTASVSGLLGTDENAAYGSSKAAVIGLTRYVASMYGHEGIRCNAIAPGLILTERLAAALPERRLAAYAAERLLPWAADPEDIAAVVCWLASDEARCITGQTIVVDSGTTAHRPRHAMQRWDDRLSRPTTSSPADARA